MYTVTYGVSGSSSQRQGIYERWMSELYAAESGPPSLFI